MELSRYEKASKNVWFQTVFFCHSNKFLLGEHKAATNSNKLI